MKLYYDKANNPIQHDRSEHVEVDRYFNKEKLDSGLVCTPYISLERQLADILTKWLTTQPFQTITNKFGMKNIYSSTTSGWVLKNPYSNYWIIQLV